MNSEEVLAKSTFICYFPRKIWEVDSNPLKSNMPVAYWKTSSKTGFHHPVLRSKTGNRIHLPFSVIFAFGDFYWLFQRYLLRKCYWALPGLGANIISLLRQQKYHSVRQHGISLKGEMAEFATEMLRFFSRFSLDHNSDHNMRLAQSG